MLYLMTKINHNGYFGGKENSEVVSEKIFAPKCGRELIRKFENNESPSKKFWIGNVLKLYSLSIFSYKKGYRYLPS